MLALQMQDVDKSLSRRKILHSVSISVEEGEIVGLIGPNGAGKTTAMRLIANFIFPNSGSIRIAGKDILKEREAALAEFSGIIENPGLYTQFTGQQNLQLLADLRGLPPERVQAAAEFTRLGDRLKDKVRKYSLGMKQILALSMCMMMRPKLMLLDEPTNGLDPTATMHLRRGIKHAAKEGAGVLVSSHNLAELQKTADRFVFINGGEIKAEGKNDGTADMEALYREVFGISDEEAEAEAAALKEEKGDL